jgi:hypothetical protein
MTGALILALAALSGCAQTLSGPVAAPSQPLFLAGPEPRALGPLQLVSEADVQIVEKDAPTGTIAVEKTSIDMDTMVRASNGARSVDFRLTHHKGRVLRVQSLGVTEQGSFRFRLDYLQDATIALEEGEERSTKTGPTLGKSYVMEVGRMGPRVFTAEGGAPRPDEVDLVLEDGKDLLYLVAPRDPSAPPVTSELIAVTTRKALGRKGVEVGYVTASFKGVREIAGTPCAIFDLSVRAVMRKTEPDQSTVVEMTLSGEYALRLADGWEAELLLTGSTLTTGHILKNGAVIQVRAAGLARFHVAATYREPELPSPGAVAGR